MLPQTDDKRLQLQYHTYYNGDGTILLWYLKIIIVKIMVAMMLCYCDICDYDVKINIPSHFKINFKLEGGERHLWRIIENRLDGTLVRWRSASGEICDALPAAGTARRGAHGGELADDLKLTLLSLLLVSVYVLRTLSLSREGIVIWGTHPSALAYLFISVQHFLSLSLVL